ncbi:MAG: T9SS type A sorting domain-containing protein [Methanobacterium sp.]
MNTIGQIIYSEKENEQDHSVDVSKFSKGIYTVTVSGKDFVETKRVVVE